MARLIGRIARALATGAACLVIAACYGVVMDYRTVRVRDGDDEDKPGIKGIKITLVEDGADELETETDEKGEATISFMFTAAGELHVEDVDGPDNGGQYESKVVKAAGLAEDMVTNIDLSHGNVE